MPNMNCYFIKLTKAATRYVLYRKLHLRISQYLLENTCAGISSSTLLKKDNNVGVLLLRNF